MSARQNLKGLALDLAQGDKIPVVDDTLEKTRYDIN